MRNKLAILVLCVTVLGGAACGGEDGGSDAGGDANANGKGGGATSVQVETANFAFEPSDVSVPAGGTIEVTNEDDVEHSFTAEDAGIDQDVEAMSSTTIEVGDATPGTYDFICKYHPNMKGTLEITE